MDGGYNKFVISEVPYNNVAHQEARWQYDVDA